MENIATAGIVLSAILYAVVGMLVKIAAKSVSTAEIALTRGAVQCFFTFVSMRCRRTHVPILPPNANDKLWVGFRSVVCGFGFLLYFHAIAVLPLGDGKSAAKKTSY
jgi:drug/metabolite transporter (DMT)-like permease